MSHWTEEEREEMLRRRQAGSMVTGLSTTGMLTSFVSKGETKVTQSGAAADDFVEAEKYEGPQEGYVFKMGRWGLGYYLDRGPFGPVDDFDVNSGLGVSSAQKASGYDMDAHARGESQPEPPKEPGHGRVGALGDLLAENKQKKQDEFDALVHANRFQPTKSLDDDEVEFLNEKEEEARAKERMRREAEKEAELEYRLALAKQSEMASKEDKDKVDLAKLLGAKQKNKPEKSNLTLLSRMLVKRKPDEEPGGVEAGGKVQKTEATAAQDASSSLLGLGDYGDSDDEAPD